MKETNQKDKDQKADDIKSFQFSNLLTALKRPVIGTAIFTGFLLTMAQFTMIIGFQTFSVDVLKITPAQTGIFFAVFGIMGILAQLCVPLITRLTPSKALVLLVSTILCFAAMFASGFTSVLIPFGICLCVYGLFNGLRNPMLNAIIADNTDQNEQGEVLGINQSYASIGQTLGPISAGFAVLISVPSVFFLSSFFILIAFLLCFRLKAKA